MLGVPTIWKKNNESTKFEVEAIGVTYTRSDEMYSIAWGNIFDHSVGNVEECKKMR